MILGAIFAGGQARRFGSDKAQALFAGRALLDHVADRLRPQCDALVVVGRAWPGLVQVMDRPAPGLGPLAALAGALDHAMRGGYEAVLTSGCDLPDLPIDLRARLSPGPAVVIGQPLLGLWPAALADALLDHLRITDDRAMRGWIAASGARPVTIDGTIANINRVADLDALHVRRD
jgi:molybdopterin-guanine dinucleotide biosynthesis protein A